MGALISERGGGERESERERVKERERIKAGHRGLHKINSSPKPLTGKRRGADYPKSL